MCLQLWQEKGMLSSSRHRAVIPPSCLRCWAITEVSIRFCRPGFGGRFCTTVVRFSTQHVSAAGISGHKALYLLFASVISEYNQTPGWQNSRIEVPEHLCNLSTLCPLYQADLPSMILMPLTTWNTTEHCLTATKPSLWSSEFPWFIKQKGWARGNKCDVPGKKKITCGNAALRIIKKLQLSF